MADDVRLGGDPAWDWNASEMTGPLTNWSELAFEGDPDEPDHTDVEALQRELQAALDAATARAKEAS